MGCRCWATRATPSAGGGQTESGDRGRIRECLADRRTVGEADDAKSGQDTAAAVRLFWLDERRSPMPTDRLPGP